MRYRNTYCPHCEFPLELGVTFAREWIGPPLSRCPRCRLVYRTGMMFWGQMSGLRKSAYWALSVFAIPYSILFYTAICAFGPLFVVYLLSPSYAEAVLGSYAFLVWVVLSALFFIVKFIHREVSLRQLVPKIEDAEMLCESEALTYRSDGTKKTWPRGVPPTCPKCSGMMELRAGDYANFYRCVGFPECQGVVEIN